MIPQFWSSFDMKFMSKIELVMVVTLTVVSYGIPSESETKKHEIKIYFFRAKKKPNQFDQNHSLIFASCLSFRYI